MFPSHKNREFNPAEQGKYLAIREWIWLGRELLAITERSQSVSNSA